MKSNFAQRLCVLGLLALFSGAQAIYHSAREVCDYQARRGTGDDQFKFGSSMEFGLPSKRSYDQDNKLVNLMEMYGATESSRNMLKSPAFTFPPDEDPNTWVGVTLDGPWGDFKVTGEYKSFTSAWWGRVLFEGVKAPGKFFLGAVLPFMYVNIDSVVWSDQTDPTADVQNQTAIDKLTSRLAAYTLKVGNLDIGSYSKTWLGDTEIYLGWNNEYAKSNSPITKTKVGASLGIILPTGEERNINHVFSVPLGNDGSYGLPVTVSASMKFKSNFKLGASFVFTWFSEKRKMYRLKTDLTQTEYLLLSTGTATYKPGNLVRLCVYGKQKVSDKVKLSLAYNGKHQTAGVYSKVDKAFDTTVVNSAATIKPWCAHTLCARIHFEVESKNPDAKIQETELSISYRLPLRGSRSVYAHYVGAELSFAF